MNTKVVSLVAEMIAVLIVVALLAAGHIITAAIVSVFTIIGVLFTISH